MEIQPIGDDREELHTVLHRNENVMHMQNDNITRVQQLEEENARLRAEINRLTNELAAHSENNGVVDI